MISEEERVASFAIASTSASASAAKKRQSTKMAAASSSTLQWPHPTTGRNAKASGIPSPSLLAKHGFYHSPTAETPDAVTHFLYPDLQITHWQAGDDPLERLEQVLPGNGWCRIFRSHRHSTLDEQSGRWIWQSAELLPTSKEMVQARKETFASFWPYDGKKGWKPTSKKLAEAGFIFTPTTEEPDNAKCIYCDKALGGWEKSDDPVHEHQRRHPECAFFNCELREPPQPEAAPMDEDPVAEEAVPAPDAEEDAEPVVPPKKAGKRAVSTTTRKASSKVSKAKKSTAAVAQEEEETPDQQDDAPASVDAAVATETPAEEPSETVAPTRRGGAKSRSVSSRRTAAAAATAEAPEDVKEPVESEAAAPAVEEEEPVKTLSKKKGATGLGNGQQTTAARPTRAASRRATKAIGLLSADDDVDRIPRRPDKEDLEKRELALSDPVPFPSPPLEDLPEPATDPVQPAKPKRSRSKNKKLDQAATPKEPTPEPEPEPEPQLEPEEDAAPLPEDNTVIEHDASEAEAEDEPEEAAAAAAEEEEEEVPEEPVEEPKRRGRGAKASSTVASAKASTAGTRSRKASAKVTTPSEPEIDETAPVATAAHPVVFPSMSSEADEVPARQHSSRSVSNALAAVPSKTSSDAATTAGSRKPSSASTSSKRGSNKSTPVASDDAPAPTDSDIVEDDSDAHSGLLPNAGSQATIRGAPRSSSALPPSSPPPSSSHTGRAPLSQLPQLATLELDEAQRSMTLGEWLQMKAEAAADEMREAGEAQLADLENQVRAGRATIERRLRGRA